MTGHRPFAAGPLVAALALAGCVAVTINVTFPQEKLDSAAASIEDLVRGPGSPAPAPAPAGQPKSERTTADAVAAAWPGPRVAEAQVPELKTRTPEIMAAIQSRNARYPQVAAALAAGCLGENGQGLLEARPGTGCPAGLGGLVAAENRDRTLIYRTLVEQNNMAPTELPRVQAAFAKANRDKAPAGAWVQEPDGRWVRK